MLTSVQVYASSAVQIYKNKPNKVFRGGRGEGACARCAGPGSAEVFCIKLQHSIRYSLFVSHFENKEQFVFFEKEIHPSLVSFTQVNILFLMIDHGTIDQSAAVAQWVRVFAPQSGRLSVRIRAATDLSRKTGSDSSTTKRSSIDVSVTSPRR